MRRLAWTFAARIGDKYQIRLARPILILSQLQIWSQQTITCNRTNIVTFRSGTNYLYLNSNLHTFKAQNRIYVGIKNAWHQYYEAYTQ